ncbi:MAG: hypothetical protein ABFD07_14005, partial [Methanobacterium sp.]
MITLILDSKKRPDKLSFILQHFQRSSFLFLGEKDAGLFSLLNSKGWKEFQIPVRDREYKEKFLREYIDIVGAIGAEQ